MSFIDSIYEKAKADVKTIAIPEYDNDYMMKAAVKAHHDGIANILLVGPAAEVQARADELGLDIAGIPERENPRDVLIAMPPCRRK